MKKLALIAALGFALNPVNTSAQGMEQVKVNQSIEPGAIYSKIYSKKTFSIDFNLELVYKFHRPKQTIKIPCENGEDCVPREVVVKEERQSVPGLDNIVFWRYRECGQDERPAPNRGQHMVIASRVGYSWSHDSRIVWFHDYNCDFIIDDFSVTIDEFSDNPDEWNLKKAREDFKQYWGLMQENTEDCRKKFFNWLIKNETK